MREAGPAGRRREGIAVPGVSGDRLVRDRKPRGKQDTYPAGKRGGRL